YNNCMKPFVLLVSALLLLLVCNGVHADDATWDNNPVSGDWNTADNRTPAVVPTNIATFNASNITDISVSQFLSYIDNLVFNPGASVYSITSLSLTSLDLYGGGIIHNSVITLNFNFAL